MKKNLLIVFSVFITQLLFAQAGRQVSGVITDSTGTSIIAASVKLTSPKDTLFTRTDIDGKFTFGGVKSSQFLITASSLGYQTLNKRFLYKDDASSIKLDVITLKGQSNILNTVNVTAKTGGVVLKQDTVEYRASDFPVRENSVAEDVIKKLPGVDVDKDGNVTTQGKSVTRVRRRPCAS